MANEDNESQFTLRCSLEMRQKAEKLAKMKGQSLAEWLRRAVQNEIDREVNGESDISDDELRETIRSVVEEVLAEKKGGKND